MEGDMVKSFSGSNIDLIKKYFVEHLPGYQVISENSRGPHWAIKLAKNEIEIDVSGDIGFSVGVSIDNTRYDLWQYDKSVNQAMKTTDKNILYQLDVLTRFLSKV